MELPKLYYTDRYKYIVEEKYEIDVEIYGHNGGNDFAWITEHGRITVLPGYGWDGPSGPAIDTDTVMIASLVHDVLYQLMRLGIIPQGKRKVVDKIFAAHCKAGGCGIIRSQILYWGVRIGGKSSAHPNSRRRVLVAP